MSHEVYPILLTIDVEDWFQVENFKEWIPFSSWSSCELRVEKNTHLILDLIDSHNGQRATGNGHGAKLSATFFILGWIAERLPHLVREIHARGHEVASHGYYHNLSNQQLPDHLKQDLTDSKNCLEDIISAQVYGYRSPSFAINADILKLIEECGYLYDSSFNSFGIHGRYGRLKLSQNQGKGIALRISEMQNPKSFQGVTRKSKIRNPKSKIFYELPISNIKVGNHILPWGGGGYFRLIPPALFKMGVRSILKKQGAYLFYMHPWEVDPQQPIVNHASMFFKFRHYVNLDKAASRLSTFIETFKAHSFVTCHEYLEIPNAA